MITRLQKQGDHYILVLDAELVKKLQMDENTVLNVEANDVQLSVSRVVSPVPQELRDAAAQFALENYSETFRKLAE